MSEHKAKQNTNRELWREAKCDGTTGDYYNDSIFVTHDQRIGVNCSGTVFVASPREWHTALAERDAAIAERDETRQFARAENQALRERLARVEKLRDEWGMSVYEGRQLTRALDGEPAGKEKDE